MRWEATGTPWGHARDGNAVPSRRHPPSGNGRAGREGTRWEEKMGSLVISGEKDCCVRRWSLGGVFFPSHLPPPRVPRRKESLGQPASDAQHPGLGQAPGQVAVSIPACCTRRHGYGHISPCWAWISHTGILIVRPSWPCPGLASPPLSLHSPFPILQESSNRLHLIRFHPSHQTWTLPAPYL